MLKICRRSLDLTLSGNLPPHKVSLQDTLPDTCITESQNYHVINSIESSIKKQFTSKRYNLLWRYCSSQLTVVIGHDNHCFVYHLLHRHRSYMDELPHGISDIAEIHYMVYLQRFTTWYIWHCRYSLHGIFAEIHHMVYLTLQRFTTWYI